MARIFKSIGYHYERSFKSHPLATLAIANGFCSISGDAAAQLIPILTSKDLSISFDFKRLLRYFVFGFNMGPISGKWNELLDRFVQPRSKTATEDEKDKDVEMSLLDGNGPHHGHHHQPTRLSSPAQLPFQLICKMVILDQLLMAPFSLLLFLSFMGITEGLELSLIQERIRNLFWRLLIANWQVWPIMQLINFRFMPLRLRVPFSASCGILWTIFLSYAASA